MSIITRIVRLLQEQGLTFRSLADKAGLSENQLRNLLKARQRPNPYLETIERLAWALRVSESTVIDTYPALTELLQQFPDIPFKHYQRLRDIPTDERPQTVEELRNYYLWQRGFWQESGDNASKKKKTRRNRKSLPKAQ
jgi:transcriptional regulator with XRE-family HTH domain